LQFLNIFRWKWTEEDIDIELTPGYSSTPENESRKHVLTPPMVDRTSLQTIIYEAILIALTRRGFLYLALPIIPCALTFPLLETSCKPLRRREFLARVIRKYVVEHRVFPRYVPECIKKGISKGNAINEECVILTMNIFGLS
jgi:hypothetical protein